MNGKILAAVFMLLLFLSGCSNDNSFEISRVDVRAEILEDGDLYIEELFTYEFKGEYEYIDRQLEILGHDGVEFFEAYVPPSGNSLGEFSYKESSRIDVIFDQEDESYHAKVDAHDESANILYRYRIDEAASRFRDAGELDWNFFVLNNNDIHNLKIETVFPDSFSRNEIDMFDYHRDGGNFSKITGQSIIYETDFLSEYETLTLHFLFPESQLAKAEMKKAMLSREERAEKAKDRQESYEKRADRLMLAQNILKVMTYLFIIAAIPFIIPVKKWLAKWKARSIPLSELENMNPVQMMMFYRKGELKVQDFLAGVLAFQLPGLLKMRMQPASKRWLDDPLAPDSTIHFALLGQKQDFKGSDQTLITWLFKTASDGHPTFTLSAIAGPSGTDLKNSNSRLAAKAETFRANFDAWKQETEKEWQAGNLFVKDKVRRAFIFPIALIHFLLIAFMYMADARSWGEVTIAVLGIGGFAAFLMMKFRSRKMAVFYLAACFFAGVQVHDEHLTDSYFSLVLLSLLFAFFLPRMTLSLKAAAYREAIISWRGKLAKGGYPAGRDAELLEKLTRAAILLGTGPGFIARYKEKYPGEIPAEPPFLFDEKAAEIIDFTISTFIEK